MKIVDIYVLGKYDSNTHEGQWIYYLGYCCAVKKESGFVKDAKSSHRMCLYALHNALNHITEPCELVINSKVPLGFANIKDSANRDMLVQIQKEIVSGGHIVNFEPKANFKQTEIWEKQYGNKK